MRKDPSQRRHGVLAARCDIGHAGVAFVERHQPLERPFEPCIGWRMRLAFVGAIPEACRRPTYGLGVPIHWIHSRAPTAETAQ
jgi:hypothetical protein